MMAVCYILVKLLKLTILDLTKYHPWEASTVSFKILYRIFTVLNGLNSRPSISWFLANGGFWLLSALTLKNRRPVVASICLGPSQF